MAALTPHLQEELQKVSAWVRNNLLGPIQAVYDGLTDQLYDPCIIFFTFVNAAR